MNLKSFAGFIVCMFAMFLGVNLVFADQNTPQAQNAKEKAGQSQKDDQWHFLVMPAVSFVGMKGTVGANYDTAHVDLSASEFSKDTKTGAALFLAALKGNHSISLSASYVKLNDDAPVMLGTTPTIEDFTLEMTQVQLEYGYRFLNKPRFTMEALGGVRYWNLNAKIEEGNYVPGYALRTSQTANWIDPIVGLRIKPSWSPQLSFPVSADIGGFGLGSQITSSGRAGVNYMFTHHIMAEVGYGYTYVNYRQRGAVFDMTLYGPYAALGFMF